MGLKPFRTAASCIDWSIPMLSIFATPAEASAWAAAVNTGRAKANRIGVPRRPLKEKTLQRIARGLVKWVIQAKRPYIVRIAHGDQSAGGARWGDSSHSVDVPLGTVAASKDFAAVDVTLAPYSVPNLGEREGQAPRSASVEQPMPTVTSKGNGARLVAATLAPFAQTLNHGGEEHRGQSIETPLATVTGANDARALVAALITKHYGGNEGPGSSPATPLDSITAKDHNAVTVAYLSHQYGSNTNGGQGSVEKPLKTITSGGHHAAIAATVSPITVGAGGPGYAGKPKSVDEPLGTVMVNDRREIVAAFLQTYYGNSKDGHSPAEPMPTVVSKDRIGLVTVVIDDQTYVITDIAMRMLTPRELLLAQGFPADYRVDKTADGTTVSKADQVKLIGNAVPPPFARALAFANVVEQGVFGAPARRRRAVAS